MKDFQYPDYIGQALQLLDQYLLREEGIVIPWFTKIDLAKLDFNSIHKNVLGQVFGSNIVGKKELNSFLGLGFSFTWNGESWQELTPADKQRWIEEIKKRQGNEQTRV